jgi:hypothetical protein
MGLSSGVYSLIGVVVGGAVTGGVQWALRVRADRIETRVARRQVKAGLEQTRKAVITLHARSDVTGARTEATLRQIDALSANSDRLARHLSEGEWQTLNEAYRAARSAVLFYDSQIDGDRDVSLLGPMRRAFDAAIEAIGG